MCGEGRHLLHLMPLKEELGDVAPLPLGLSARPSIYRLRICMVYL
jgi:hypothetical protein